MSLSDQSDDGIYQSDEEITSFMHMRNSSSDETLDEQEEHKCIRRDSGRGSMDMQRDLSQILWNKPKLPSSTPSESKPTGQEKPKIQLKDSLLPLPKSKTILGERTSVKLPLGREAAKMTSKKPFPYQMFEFGNIVQTFNSNIKSRLLNSMKRNEAVAYLSPSFMKDWAIPSEVPPNVICDVCLFSDTQPVFLLTFHQGGETDKILRYNATVTRHLVSKVRKVSLSNFTAIGGALDESDCSTEERFTSQMQKLESEARWKFVPNWLYMDGARCSQVLEIFLKMGQKCGKEWVNVSGSLNELEENAISATNEKGPSGTTENGFEGQEVDNDRARGVQYRNAKESSNNRMLPTTPTVMKLPSAVISQGKLATSRKVVPRQEEIELSPLFIENPTSESTQERIETVDLNKSLESIKVG